MKLSNEVTLSLSNKDMNRLVADALDRNVLYCPGQNVVVVDIDYSGTWQIILILEEREEE